MRMIVHQYKCLLSRKCLRCDFYSLNFGDIFFLCEGERRNANASLCEGVSLSSYYWLCPACGDNMPRISQCCQIAFDRAVTNPQSLC